MINAEKHTLFGNARPILITGGAGFIGANLAHRLLSAGRTVRIYDNLSRDGVAANLQWLRETHGGRLQVMVGDMRDREALRNAAEDVSNVYHFAAQVAVTTSLEDPVQDFEINIMGTLNLLESIRSHPRPPSLLLTSTNKVYGDLNGIGLTEQNDRYAPTNPHCAARGVDENQPLDFHSPYGCSKGAADQYALDYARSYGLDTVVFRMSCIYGLHQFGTEDQGWVAHFLIRALEGKPIRVYGDGRQVRDILFIEDLVDALILAQEMMPAVRGSVFNIGGGPRNTISLLELIDLIGAIQRIAPRVEFSAWRTGDQKYYVSNTEKFQHATGWQPAVSVADGVRRLQNWLLATRFRNLRIPREQVA